MNNYNPHETMDMITYAWLICVKSLLSLSGRYIVTRVTIKDLGTCVNSICVYSCDKKNLACDVFQIIW